MTRCLFIITITISMLYSCKKGIPANCNNKQLNVTATAYNSLAYQTSSNPHITAFGDSLKPGLRYIAVSRDLIDSGLVHNTKVKIEGFDSLFIVKDKMNRRWKNRIDIYMSVDVKKARKWGKKKVNIEYCIRTKDSTIN
ncbi:3D domain-containing protein [Winogradskyella sp.]|uniref:3D domain-containing protein n=1 Tax=Winogradskyella sp. TaxID=1883156 RepID=UPI003F6C3B52